MIEKLAAPERAAALGGLDEWSEAEGRDAIQKTFRFENFNAAFGATVGDNKCIIT